MKDKELEEIVKAFGGCKKCYGKGYATVNERWTTYDTDQDIGSPGGIYKGGRNFAIKYCKCARGLQLANLIAQERRKAKIEVLEKPILLELHIKQSQDYKQGFRDAVEQVESYRKDKLAELKEDKERKQ